MYCKELEESITLNFKAPQYFLLQKTCTLKLLMYILFIF